MVIFEIKNDVLQKIKVEGGVGHSPVKNVIKIPDGVREIIENVLDNSCVGEGYEGYDFLHFRGICIPKSVTKIAKNAFNSIKIDKEVILGEVDNFNLILDSETIILYYEDEVQKKLSDSINNPAKFEKINPILFKLSENSKNIDNWFFNKLSQLKLNRVDNAIIEFENNTVSVSITHSNFSISTITIDNPWFGRRNNKVEEELNDCYIFNSKTDVLDENRIRQLFD